MGGNEFEINGGSSSFSDERQHRQQRRRSSTAAAWNEAKLLLNLAIPTVIISLGFTVSPFLTASYVGRQFGSVYLDGFTLASLTGNLFTLSLLQGLYSASDTLSPQAFGAKNYGEVGLIAIRGFLASLMVIVPINLFLVLRMYAVFLKIGENADSSLYAWEWYRIYVCAMPFYAIYMVTWKFLSAQEIMIPLVIVCLTSCGVILPIALELLTKWFGFIGSAYAMFVYQFSQAMLLLLYINIFKPHHSQTWPGLSTNNWRDVLKWKPFKTYLVLGAGGMVASSEWIYWETLSLFVGTLGVVPLSVHTVPTQVLTVSFMIPLGIGIALAVRLGSTLPQNVTRAKKLVLGCLTGSTVLFAVMAACIYGFRKNIYDIFTTEQQVRDGCEEIWWKVTLYFFLLGIFGVNMGIATGLGMQWTLGIVTTVFLWVVGLPAAYYFAIARGGGLGVAWSWVYPPYIGMNVILFGAFILADWDKIAENIRIREGAQEERESFIQKANAYGSFEDEETLKNGNYQDTTVITFRHHEQQ